MAGTPSYVDCSFCDQNLLSLFISHSFHALLSFTQHSFLFFCILYLLSMLFLAMIFTFSSLPLSRIYSCRIFLDSVLDEGHLMVYDLDPEILLLPPPLIHARSVFLTTAVTFYLIGKHLSPKLTMT